MIWTILTVYLIVKFLSFFYPSFDPFSWLYPEERAANRRGTEPRAAEPETRRAAVVTSAASPTAVRMQAQPEEEELPAEKEEPPENALRTVEEVQYRTDSMINSLRIHAHDIQDRELSDGLERIAVSLRLIAEDVHLDENDLPAVCRFLERYGQSVLRLTATYAGFQKAGGITSAMKKSMAQIKTMLLDFAEAIERFRLSLFENDIMNASAEIGLTRTLLARDGLGEDRGMMFAATSIMEAEGEC